MKKSISVRNRKKYEKVTERYKNRRCCICKRRTKYHHKYCDKHYDKAIEYHET